ncbi:alpha-2-macroglobulin [Arenibacter certesii]|uniref:Alpha-2-macroglobulin n=2 Tax=Arenibacter certesii TaxID=228955 RepID=A0A918IP77_9FLAO|nr:alpha-2-macroglobulin [Arenibacter certesii]
MAQSQEPTSNYDVLWQQVEKLEKETMTKSALEVVNKISAKAKKENQKSQIVKSLLYSSKYSLTLEEEAQLNIITDFKVQIAASSEPVKNILEGYLANLYWQYFQQNRYRFYERTKTEAKIDSTDFRTWDLTTLFNEIGNHFEASLENPSLLQKLPVQQFNEILEKQKESEKYRPTLFDLLAHNALDFFSRSENSISQPADKFQLDNADVLCDAKQFVQQEFNPKEKISPQAKALQIYQQLVAFHSSDTSIEALIDVDIARLKFIRENAVFPNIEDQYIEVLQNSAEAYKGDENGALYRYEIALALHENGNTYHPTTNVAPRWKQKEALEIGESVIAQFPNSKAAEKCNVLKSQILATSLQLTAEMHIPVNSPSRLLVNYKNISQLQLSAHKVTIKELKALNELYPQEKKLAFIKKLAIERQWESSLTNEKDYQNHSTEIILPELPNGYFVLLAIPKGSNDNNYSFSPIQVTDIALVESTTNDFNNYQVTDRNNGSPIARAKVKFTYQSNYNKPFVTKTMTTDDMGMVTLPRNSSYKNSISAEVTHNGQVAYFNEFYVPNKYNSDQKETTYPCFLLTDRSIYRPGQTLYFKGIALKRSDDNSEILTQANIRVLLKDVNQQEVSAHEFKTNDYGSFSGEFIIPSNGLTGEFYLEVSSTEFNIKGHQTISVEEYKRPKFETTFEPITDTYRLNDSIKVTGKAMGYAGSNITNAQVKYTVKRIVNFPIWYGRHLPIYRGTPQEIAQGSTTTDYQGKYVINFKAIPDLSVPKQNMPIFNYEVTADITDLNGETQSTTTTVSVGYHALTAKVKIADLINRNIKKQELNITTHNLNGQFIPTKGTLKMYKLNGPDHVLRARSWTAPDYSGFKEETFKELFPHEAFGDEDDSSQWENGELVWEDHFDTEKSKKIDLALKKKWTSGKYRIELSTKDRFGEEVEDIAYTTLYSNSDKTLADNQLFQIKTDKTSYAVGDQVILSMGSAAKDLTVSLFVEKDRKIVATHKIKLNNNIKTIKLPVTKEDLGGFSITYSFSAFNSFQNGNITIPVPFPNKDLQIETVSFRDKIKPGTDETWSFKVKGSKGNGLTAEIMASMYDASLDAFKPHSWDFSPYQQKNYYSNFYMNPSKSFSVTSFSSYADYNQNNNHSSQLYDSFNWFGLHFGYGIVIRDRMMMKSSAPLAVMEDATEAESLNESVVVGFGKEISQNKVGNISVPIEEDKNKSEFGDIQIRKNLQETAFFFPQLLTDKEGNVSFNFTTPEALTQWKLQLLAHTKSLESATSTFSSVTQKELMIIPNAPRFLREGDQITFSSKISNLTDKELVGKAHIELIDAVTGKAISKELLLSRTASPSDLTTKEFNVNGNGNTEVSWTIKIPEGVQAVQYKVMAVAGNYSDGEQNILPVLSNRTLVTETLPMYVNGNQTKDFTLDKLKNVNSSTLKHHQLSLEITSNPAWYALQALPYLMEYPYDCSEQIFSRYYANSLGAHIANSNPRIQEVFKQWTNSDALLSNLEKNQELKSILIQETPWLRDAQSETEQKKRIALLFDLNKLKNDQQNSLRQLQQNQMASGGWAWFNGGRENRFITQHIIIGFGHLNKLTSANVRGNASAFDGNDNQETQEMISKAITYLDAEFLAEYERMKKHATDLSKDHLSATQLHYLYMRSFFPDHKMSRKASEIKEYYLDQAQQYWTNKSLYSKGLLSLVLYRNNHIPTAKKIILALEENSITSEEMGMYWKENTASWHWHQAPIETQSLLIEAFSEIHNDTKKIELLKLWLLKDKQTNHWKTTKATTEAVYALLLQGSDWLSVSEGVDILIGGKKIDPAKFENVTVEAGTGYFKTSWSGAEITHEMAKVQLTKKSEGSAWGSLTWQYFEDLDKITSAATPLKLKKRVFRKNNTATGEELSEITNKTELNVGDLVRVRIELRSDRGMEFVHMKDMRASGLEPTTVLSSYKWQDGLGYYENVKDASVNFFFDYLPKGVFIFEYDLRVNNAGDFSNGITTIQSMYAPEFSSHSEGVRIQVN